MIIKGIRKSLDQNNFDGLYLKMGCTLIVLMNALTAEILYLNAVILPATRSSGRQITTNYCLNLSRSPYLVTVCGPP